MIDNRPPSGSPEYARWWRAQRLADPDQAARHRAERAAYARARRAESETAAERQRQSNRASNRKRLQDPDKRRAHNLASIAAERRRMMDPVKGPAARLRKAEQKRAARQQPEKRERIAAQSAASKKRRSDEPAVKLRGRLRARIRAAVKNASTDKCAKTEALVGCSLHQLRAHLQSRFVSGMTWDNMGRWHIDHVRPCASFDLSTAAGQMACFHWTNLQPLWAEENLRKGATIDVPLRVDIPGNDRRSDAGGA